MKVSVFILMSNLIRLSILPIRYYQLTWTPVFVHIIMMTQTGDHKYMNLDPDPEVRHGNQTNL